MILPHQLRRHAMIHIFTAENQPATNYTDRSGARAMRCKNPASRMLLTCCCRKRLPARDLTAQCYYDQTLFSCNEGKGCKAPKKPNPGKRTSGATAQMKGSKLKQDVPRSSLARLVRRRCRDRETTVWVMHTSHPKVAGDGYAADTAQWVRERPPTDKMLEGEIKHHPHGSRFWLRRERRTSWAEWEATPNGA